MNNILEVHIMVLRLPFLVEIEFGNVGFWGEENRSTQSKTSPREGKNQQEFQPTYVVNVAIATQATLVGGKCSHHLRGFN